MRIKSVIICTFFFLKISVHTNAQYCFWVANQSSKTFYSVKLRANRSSNSFKDVLPYDYLKSGEHCWVETTSLIEFWDVQITKLDGTVVLFTYKDVGGMQHINQRYITVNARKLHTLIIGENSMGQLNFSYYETDALDFGNPCSN